MKALPDSKKPNLDYARIEKAIDYLTRNYPDQPDLQTLAKHLKLSPYHLQRLFHRWAGISPKQFVRFLTLQQAKALLKQSKSILDTSFDSGLSGPGRLHDLFVTMAGVTPGEFKTMGQGLEIIYGIHSTPFGPCLVGVTSRGICHLSFEENLTPAHAEKELTHEWGNAVLTEDQKATQQIIEKIFHANRRTLLRLFLKGTNFQLKVWEALLKIPKGAVISYEDLAVSIKKPKATRAVSRAVAGNPIAYLIPCHRVIHKNGVVDGYRWKTNRKKALLAWESGTANSKRVRLPRRSGY